MRDRPDSRLLRFITWRSVALLLIGGGGLLGLWPAPAQSISAQEADDAVRERLDANLTIGGNPHDWPQLGGSPLRNNTPAGKGVPTSWKVGEFDETSGAWISDQAVNIKWVARLGSQTYGNPVVAGGRIFVGSNNGGGYLDRYPKSVDLGCLLCFREADGGFLWQHSSEKLATGLMHDWPDQGVCSSPIVQGDRLWIVNNRGEVICLDTEGFHDNEDDGPETGLWRPLFQATLDLRPESFIDREPESVDRWSYQQTIRSLIASVDRQAPAHLEVNRESETRRWIVSERAGATPKYELALQGTALSIRSIEDAAAAPLLFETKPLNDLSEGIVSPALRALFLAAGVRLPERVAVRAVEPGKLWELDAVVESEPQVYRIRVRSTMLACEAKAATVDPREADVVWSFDMMNELGVSQHNMATCAPTLWGDVLFICTSNGVDLSHVGVPSPDAPSFLAMDKRTGEVLWTDHSPGRNILHGQWSCPAVGVLGGVPQVIFPGGDGWLYSFRADRWRDRQPELLWKFDANPKTSQWELGGRGDRNELIAVPVIYDGLVYAVVGQDPEHGEGPGRLWCIDPTRRGDVSAELAVDGDGLLIPLRREQAVREWTPLFKVDRRIWDGLDQGLLSQELRQSFEAVGVKLPDDCRIIALAAGSQWRISVGEGESEQQFQLTAASYDFQGRQHHSLRGERRTAERAIPNPNSAVVWHYDRFDINGDGQFRFDETMHRGIGSPTIKNGLLFVTDLAGLVHCVNAKTGRPFWTFDLMAACWTTPLVVEDRVYIADEDGCVSVLALSPDPDRSTRPTNSPRWGRREPRQSIEMPEAIYTTPIVANNVLYIATRAHLFAIQSPEE